MKVLYHKTRRHFKKQQIRVGRYLAGLGLPEYTILTVFSVIMGMAAGFAGVGLHELIELLASLTYGEQGRRESLGFFIILIPALGMGIQSLMTWLAPKAAAQKGVMGIIKAVGMRNGRMPLAATIFHFLAPAICIGSGGTVGPEAPAAQSGAGVVSALGRSMGLSDSRQRLFTAAGAGAAIAAIFNTPLAGVFFAMEVVLLHDFRASALSAFLLASVSASAVSRIIVGNEPAFTFAAVNIGAYKLYVFYLLLGIAAGLVSVGFIRSNEWIKAGCARIFSVVPKPVAMIFVGLLMGLAGFWQPGIFGVGYESMNQILAGMTTAQGVVILLVLKFLLVSLILGAGGFGGVFAPSLFMGSCLGFLFALGVGGLFGLPLDTTTYTLVGMGAVLAGINSVPLTAIMILFEMTNDYEFILPLMLGVVGSTLVVQMSLKGSIYIRALKKAGYHFSQGRDLRVLESIDVANVARHEIFMVPESTSLAELIQSCLEHPFTNIYTTDRNGKINGVILSSNLHQLITEYENLLDMVIAKDLSDASVPLLKEGQSLDHALQMFAKYRVDEMPVVRAGRGAKVIGALHYQDVLKAYNDAKVKLNLTDSLASDMKALDVNESHEVLPGFSIVEVEAPRSFMNKTLQQLRLRNRFDIDVLMIEQDGGPFASSEEEVSRSFPQSGYKFRRGDRIIVFGRDENVQAFKEQVSKARK